jgi:hypothetical protein
VKRSKKGWTEQKSKAADTKTKGIGRPNPIRPTKNSPADARKIIRARDSDIETPVPAKADADIPSGVNRALHTTSAPESCQNLTEIYGAEHRRHADDTQRGD